MVIGGADVCLGMDRADVEAAIGEGRPVRKRYYYYANEMAIDYNADGKVDFIEFLGGIDGSLHPAIYGCSVFDTFAEELVKLLQQKNNGEINALERGCLAVFKDISIGLYRETTPDDVSEMIEEMKAAGISAADNEDIKAEMRKANHWATIGIGVAGYYRC